MDIKILRRANRFADLASMLEAIADEISREHQEQSREAVQAHIIQSASLIRDAADACIKTLKGAK